MEIIGNKERMLFESLMYLWKTVSPKKSESNN
mgnify:CR=1 FL=1